MNDKINEFNDFANQTKAILEKLDIKKPVKRLKIFQIAVVLFGFLALLAPTVLYLLGFSVSVYMITGLALCCVCGIFFPILSVLKKERVCMLTYVISLAISTVMTLGSSFFINYYLHIYCTVIERKAANGLLLNFGWPVVPLAFLMLLICILVYFCFKKKICEYSFEQKYIDVSEND